MAVDHTPETSQFRVTLFVGPQPLEGKPCTCSCVFNVKKRSWKGGIQVGVEITRGLIDTLGTEIGFANWLALALDHLADKDRLPLQERAHELFIQAVCWCKLDLALESGLSQESQCLTHDLRIAEVRAAVLKRTNFITSYVASELDLAPRSVAAP